MALLAALQAMDRPEERPSERADALEAFEALMRQHERLVLGTALRLVGNMEDAKDISQEVFLRFYKNFGRLENAQCAPAWLYRVTVNACRDFQRRRPPSAPVDGADELAAPGNDPQVALSEAERRRALLMVLQMLPEKERAAVVLRDLEGLSTEETARALGSSEATVRSQISKARVKLKNYLERYFRRRE
jgi:RNA polymerase sigma-70 factor (ECF subfamily)